MSNELYNEFIAQGCLPHQASFAAKFLESGSGLAHLLLRPPGSGSTFAVTAIIRELIEKNEAKLILLLVRAQPLVEHWKSILQDMDAGLPVEVLSPRRLRELDFERASEDAPLLERGIAIVNVRPTPHLNLELVLEAPWDLLVVDEVDGLSPRIRTELVDRLIGRQYNIRSLLIGQRLRQRPNRLLDHFGGELSVTEWNPVDLIDLDGTRLLPELSFTWLPYRRSNEEVRFLEDLQEALSSFVEARRRRGTEDDPDRRGHRLWLQQQTILQGASSSLFALEGRLQRFRHRRIEAAHEKFRPSNADFEAEFFGAPEDDGFTTNQEELIDTVGLNDVLDPFRKQIELLPADSKFKALAEFLRTKPNDRVCIVTSLHETAEFLASALREMRSNVRSITGMSTGKDREYAIENFTEHGGVLIVTPASITPMISADIVLFYDVPSRPDALDDQVGLFMRRSGFKSIRMFALFDESGVLEIERNRPIRPFES